MSKYDLLLICGMPRSGTTFLNNLFSIGIFGSKFFGHHSKKYYPMGSNLIDLQEPQIISYISRHGIRIDEPLRWIVQYWRKDGERFDDIIVLKNPQAVFQCPIKELYNFRIKYIFCVRIDFNAWKKSFIALGAHNYIKKENMHDSHYRPYWGGELDKPESIDDRIEYLYNLYRFKILELKKILNDDSYCMFYYDHIVESLMNITKMFCNEQYMDEKYIIDIVDTYWRAPIV